MDTFSVLILRRGIIVVISWWILGIVVGVSIALFFANVIKTRRAFGALEISETELGIGTAKIKIRPNHEDTQIAYKLWVEVSTRKIGLPIDLDHDVIYEIYNSWYEFFTVTRDLIKNIPVGKIRKSRSTERIVHVAVAVLNDGLRPHLTLWQARFRKWYDRELQKDDALEIAPQDVQKRFPQYDELTRDLLVVNNKLIEYRKILRRISIDG